MTTQTHLKQGNSCNVRNDTNISSVKEHKNQTKVTGRSFLGQSANRMDTNSVAMSTLDPQHFNQLTAKH